MITTFQALIVAVLAILPGASYSFALEKVSGSFGEKLSDRLIRFLSASAIFQSLLSGPAYLAYKSFVVTGRLMAGDIDWRLLWVFSLIYVVIPSLAGHFIGKSALKAHRWAVWLIGKGVVPTAWDKLWRDQPNALVRIKLRSGVWLGGVYATAPSGRRSYAGGFPSDGDLHLTRQLLVDPDSGAYKEMENDTPKIIERGLWVRASDIEYLDIQEF